MAHQQRPERRRQSRLKKPPSRPVVPDASKTHCEVSHASGRQLGEESVGPKHLYAVDDASSPSWVSIQQAQNLDVGADEEAVKQDTGVAAAAKQDDARLRAHDRDSAGRS